MFSESSQRQNGRRREELKVVSVPAAVNPARDQAKCRSESVAVQSAATAAALTSAVALARP